MLIFFAFRKIFIYKRIELEAVILKPKRINDMQETRVILEGFGGGLVL
jgi:hypothetical protein